MKLQLFAVKCKVVPFQNLPQHLYLTHHLTTYSFYLDFITGAMQYIPRQYRKSQRSYLLTEANSKEQLPVKTITESLLNPNPPHIMEKINLSLPVWGSLVLHPNLVP